MQADFMLYVRSWLDTLRGKKARNWHPVTLVYAANYYNRAFPIFGRASSRAYFKQMAAMFDNSDKSDLDRFIEELGLRRILVPSWQGDAVPVRSLMNYDGLATQP